MESQLSIGSAIVEITGGSVVVDAIDHDRVALWPWAWYVNDRGYAATHDYGVTPSKCFTLHQFILGFPGHLIDHENRNKLDCRRSNLRRADDTQNQANKARQRTKRTSRYKGVFWQANTSRFEARICCRGVRKYLGASVCEEEAARLYDAAAREYFGEFAYLNFPQEAVA